MPLLRRRAAAPGRPHVPLAAFAALALPALLLPPAPPAAAGPWTEPPGRSFMSLSSGVDPDGPTGLRRDLYYAFGWAEGTTVGLDLSQQRRASGGDFRGRAEVFMRRRVWEDGQGSVASVQTEFGAGVGGAKDAPDMTTRLLLGRGYATRWGGGWSEAGLGWRTETGDRADRVVAGLATGLHPAPDWMAMAGAEVDLRADRAARDWEVVRLHGTLAREVSGALQIYLKAEAPVWGRGTGEGLDLRLGLWRRF